MKKHIRRNTFETNSSSVHSLCIDKSGREECNISLNKKGKIEVRLGSFGKDYCIYDTQIEKLSYLMTCLKYISKGLDIESIYDQYEFRVIEDAIKEYVPGCTGITIVGSNDDGEIDHQSIPYGSIEIINSYDSDAVIDFVFNRYVTLKTDCD